MSGREALLRSIWALGGAIVLGGCDVRVGRSGALWLLWLVPVLVAFYVFSFRRGALLLQRFASTEMLARLRGGGSHSRRAFKAALIVAAFAALVLSLAELKWGFRWEEVRRKGVDIVVALDVSDSMLVEDGQQGGGLSRLERAKREITDLLRLIQGRRQSLERLSRLAR